MCCEKNIEVVRRFWERCWNLHELDALDQTHHLTFSQNGEPMGVSAFKSSLAGFFESFPDARVSIEDVMAAGDRVLTRVTYRGTHLGAYQGISATGKTICVGGLELFLLVSGRIVQHWHETDHLLILQQIGATAIAPKE